MTSFWTIYSSTTTTRIGEVADCSRNQACGEELADTVTWAIKSRDNEWQSTSQQNILYKFDEDIDDFHDGAIMVLQTVQLKYSGNESDSIEDP
jgi:hypothetical protein